jgi:paraquat-inducible protein B
MTEPDNKTGDTSNEVTETGPARARTRRTPWRGWLMAIPLAALILVAYLFIRTWILTGPTITVTFPRSEGIGPQGTAVKYKGVEVGSVTAVTFIADLKRIKVTLDMHSSVADWINSGTRFWIVQPKLVSGDVSQLLSGAYIAMSPGQGKPQDHFQGTLEPPPLPPPDQRGTVVILTAPDKGGLSHGSKVLYRGLNAGRVLGTRYDAKADDVRIKLFVKSPFDQHLSGETRFWRAGGLDITKKNSGIEIEKPSITSLLQGGVAFADMKPTPGRRDSANDDQSDPVYTLYDNKSSAQGELTGPSAAFALVPPHSSLHGLTSGAPVTLQGVKVGRVTGSHLHYSLDHHDIETSATIALYAEPLGITGHGDSSKPASKARITAAIGDLVKHGMRARVASGGLILGGEKVVLDMSGGHGEKSLDRSSKPPRIPMAASSGGISEIASELGEIASKINAVPIEDIGRNLQQTTANARKLTGSPEIRQALANLNHSMANLEEITARTNREIGPTLKSLRGAADAAEAAARQIDQVAGGYGAQAGFAELVDELIRTARSIRVLADYLQQNPDALLWGKNH